MSKYRPLALHLSEQDAETVTVPFSRIDEMLSGGLPDSAYDHRSWWANRYDGKDAQNLGWQSVGWETKDLDMKRELVTFVRTVKTRSDFKETPHVKRLSIEEAKLGLAANFGVSPESIEITIKG